MNKAQIIFADPAWRFASNSAAKPGRNAMRHYKTMTDAEICAMPVKEWSEKDAMLFMWTTAPMMARSMPVLGAWGFKYISQVIWEKSRISTGYWARNRHEILIIAKRGKFPCPKPTLFPDSVFKHPTREHSRKPEYFQDRIDEVWPDHTKLELNARRPREGWMIWGDETDKFEAV